MRQVIYRSFTTAPSQRAADDIPAILAQSVAHNGLDGVTGLLYTEGATFLQVLEGPRDSIDDLVRRLRADRRHRDMTILIDRPIDERDFGDWTMIHRDRREDAGAFDDRMHVLLAGVSPDTAAYFWTLRAA